MLCNEKARLLELYKTAVWAHATAVDDLLTVQGTSKADQELIRDRASKAKLDAETARSALHAHIAEHEC